MRVPGTCGNAFAALCDGTIRQRAYANIGKLLEANKAQGHLHECDSINRPMTHDVCMLLAVIIAKMINALMATVGYHCGLHSYLLEFCIYK